MEKVTVPEFTQRMKEIVDKMSALMTERRAFQVRIQDAHLHFKKNLSKSEIQSGLKTMDKIIRGLEDIDLKIRELQIEFTIILEEKFSGLDFSMQTHQGEIRFLPEKTGVGVEISPDDIWFYQIAKKIFDVSFKDIKINNGENKE